MCVAIWVSWNFEPFVQSSNHFVAFWHTRHKPLHAGKCFHQMAVVVALSRYTLVYICLPTLSNKFHGRKDTIA